MGKMQGLEDFNVAPGIHNDMRSAATKLVKPPLRNHPEGHWIVKRTSEHTTKTLIHEVLAGEPYAYYPLGQHIVVAPGVCGGRPTFKYTRIDVRHALGLFASGRTMEQVAQGYDLPMEAMQEAVVLAARVFDRQGGRLVKQA